MEVRFAPKQSGSKFYVLNQLNILGSIKAEKNDARPKEGGKKGKEFIFVSKDSRDDWISKVDTVEKKKSSSIDPEKLE